MAWNGVDIIKGGLGAVPESGEPRAQRRGQGALEICGEEIWKVQRVGKAWFQREVRGQGAGLLNLEPSVI